MAGDHVKVIGAKEPYSILATFVNSFYPLDLYILSYDENRKGVGIIDDNGTFREGFIDITQIYDSSINKKINQEKNEKNILNKKQNNNNIKVVNNMIQKPCENLQKNRPYNNHPDYRRRK